MDSPVIDPNKLESFAMRTIGDVIAGYTGVMVSLGPSSVCTGRWPAPAR